MMLQLSHGNPPWASSANSSKAGSVSCILMQQESCASLTSDFFFFTSLFQLGSRRCWCSHPERESEWRLKGCATHSPICSITVAECCNITHGYLGSRTWSTLRLLQSHSISQVCHAATTDLQLPEKLSTFSSSFPLFPFLLRERVPEGDAVWWYCSAAQPHTTTKCLSLDVIKTYTVKRKTDKKKG